MRVAPIGLVFPAERAFAVAAQAAALTHGHPAGYLSAGTLAALIAELLGGADLKSAANGALTLLRAWRQHEGTEAALMAALRLAPQPGDPATVIERELGGGWVGEEALAIALYSALRSPTDFRTAICMAVNHSGDSDSTGSICGAIMGALLGADAIPTDWVEQVERRGEIEALSHALATLKVSPKA